jgi:glycosyltransferase involved in cell wall biosynthesis/Flp pilus assembly protein TadD
MATVSLCMIVKNEEANLAACLRPIRGLFDEIVVVDTGSADRTREIARDCGARLFDFPWCDDFSAARNESLRQARSDWFFWMDADDRLDESNVQRLGLLFEDLAGPVAYQMTVVSDEARQYDPIPQLRLFKIAPGVRWERRVHEQVAQSWLRLGYPLRNTGVVIHHTGYRSPEINHQKWERNLRLLLLDVAENPHEVSTLFHLGMTYSLLSRHQEAIPLLEKALAPMRPNHQEARFVFRYLADSLRAVGRSDLARDRCLQGLEWFPGDIGLEALERSLASGSPKATLSLSQALESSRRHYEAGRLQDAERLCEQILRVDANCVDALHLLGVIAGRAGRFDLAYEYLQAALKRKPDFAAAHNNLGNVFAYQQKLPEAVASFRNAVRCDPGFAVAHSNLGTALCQLGHLDEAVASLQEAVRLSPDSVEARNNLSLAVEAKRNVNPEKAG